MSDNNSNDAAVNEHSDITERLRAEVDWHPGDRWAFLCADAAAAIELLRVQLNEARSERDGWKSEANRVTRDMSAEVDRQVTQVERLRAALAELVAACEAWDDPGQPHTPRRVITACATARALVAPAPEPHPTTQDTFAADVVKPHSGLEALAKAQPTTAAQVPWLRKKVRGGWSVWLGDRMISDHATRDGAVAAARNLEAAERRAAAVPCPEETQ